MKNNIILFHNLILKFFDNKKKCYLKMNKRNENKLNNYIKR